MLLPIVVALLSVASIAHAGWDTSATAGPLTVTAGVLAPPSGIDATVGTCVVKQSVDVVVTWQATSSAFADGYDVLQATRKTGPYAQIAAVPGAATTSFDDESTGFATKYFYEVEATRNSWTSAASAYAVITTPARRTCA